MTHGWKALVALFILASSSASNATRIDVLIGDEDGFGIGVKPNQGFLPNDLPGYAGLGDADGTDKWFFNQQSFAFNSTLPVFPIK